MSDILTADVSWFQRFFKKREAPKYRGLYFYGDVGRGKTAVMDLFFDQVPLSKKRRVHFHAFMLEVHDFLFALRKARVENNITAHLDDDLMVAADHIAATAKLLCFDEFQVRDVADAMILGRLFTALFERGVFVVMTSNIQPNNLYLDGLQRDRFIPFIKLLQKKLRIFAFTGNVDYRLNLLIGKKHYFIPHDEASEASLNDLFFKLSGGYTGEARDIMVKGRVIHVPRAYKEICYFDFHSLCAVERSAVDYLTLVDHFSIFIVSNVPVMDDTVRNTVLRFVTFIDTLYDHRKHLILSGNALPDDLYTGTEMKDIFARTISRLNEMQSDQYLSVLGVNNNAEKENG